MTKERFDRQTPFLTKEGQKAISDAKAVIIGVGGSGSHVAQQLAYLGVRDLVLIDDDTLDETNLNRLIGASMEDQEGTPKVDIVERHLRSIDPNLNVDRLQKDLVSPEAFELMKEGHVVFGCVDNDGARLVLNEFCSAFEVPLIDIATQIFPEESDFGGRVVSMVDGTSGCLFCFDEIDRGIARLELDGEEARSDIEDIYGFPIEEIHGSGPSVVSINGVLTSLAVTEFMVHITGQRKARPFLEYSGKGGIVTKKNGPGKEDCFTCKHIRGRKEEAGVEKHLKGQKGPQA